ncbi:MAG: amidohydrolase family protein, partial [bacterium]|nr:amidohydrolase family protein [bacterium]
MRRAFLTVSIGLFIFASWAVAQDYDVLLRNGRIVDGTGNPWFRADLGLQGDKIAAIGRLEQASAKRVIDASGLTVTPGFIDIHSHARRGVLAVPGAENYIRQGVTTILEGQDGGSPLPLRPFLDKLEAADFAINFATLVGQGSIRRAVVGLENRNAEPTEIQKMKELARQAMLDGAFGISTGLFYVPGAYTPTEEVVELAKVIGELGGIHISHMRDEAAGILSSVRETIRIGEEGGLPTQ